jgi:cell wall-associated NlpC family hydrolase
MKPPQTILPLLFAAGLMALLFGCSPSVRYAAKPADPTQRRAVVVPKPSPKRHPLSYHKPDVADEAWFDDESAALSVGEFDSLSISRLKVLVDSYMGTPYRYGGSSRSGMDCSGFVTVVFNELNGINLPHTSRMLQQLGRAVEPAEAREGDLVFFRGGRRGAVNHVGIYMGAGRFAHASSTKGVVYSELDQDYYRTHFDGIRRLD